MPYFLYESREGSGNGVVEWWLLGLYRYLTGTLTLWSRWALLFVCLFVFVALCPMSTAMVIAGRSVHLTTHFPGQA